MIEEKKKVTQGNYIKMWYFSSVKTKTMLVLSHPGDLNDIWHK